MDDATFQLLFGVGIALISSFWLFSYVRNVKKKDDDDGLWSLSRLSFILSLFLGILFGLFLILYKF